MVSENSLVSLVLLSALLSAGRGKRSLNDASSYRYTDVIYVGRRGLQ